mmetsp:Transcript_382/g.1283  ORF Transcript_382/g.1283 Transcript_382/m.1283 type:complete len:524 (-) Transcript_382:144-1715(-)
MVVVMSEVHRGAKGGEEKMGQQLGMRLAKRAKILSEFGNLVKESYLSWLWLDEGAERKQRQSEPEEENADRNDAIQPPPVAEEQEGASSLARTKETGDVAAERRTSSRTSFADAAVEIGKASAEKPSEPALLTQKAVPSEIPRQGVSGTGRNSPSARKSPPPMQTPVQPSRSAADMGDANPIVTVAPPMTVSPLRPVAGARPMETATENTSMMSVLPPDNSVSTRSQSSSLIDNKVRGTISKDRASKTKKGRRPPRVPLISDSIHVRCWACPSSMVRDDADKFIGPLHRRRSTRNEPRIFFHKKCFWYSRQGLKGDMQQKVCSFCGEKNATVTCASARCQAQFHFRCQQLAMCNTEPTLFQAFCQKHSSKISGGTGSSSKPPATKPQVKVKQPAAPVEPTVPAVPAISANNPQCLVIYSKKLKDKRRGFSHKVKTELFSQRRREAVRPYKNFRLRDNVFLCIQHTAPLIYERKQRRKGYLLQLRSIRKSPNLRHVNPSVVAKEEPVLAKVETSFGKGSRGGSR